MKENIVLLNKDLPAYSQIADFEIMEQEFEKHQNVQYEDSFINKASK